MTKSPQEEDPIKAFGWGARDSSSHLSPFKFSRRETGEEDDRFKVLYCGICHSELHLIGPSQNTLTFRGNTYASLLLVQILSLGITVYYSPLKHYGLAEPGKNIGVVGLRELGHMAVKFAKAFRAKVTVINTSPSKEALKLLGADTFLVSCDQEQMQAATGTLDGIVDTVSAVHTILPLLGFLKFDGKLVLVGVPGKPLGLPVYHLISGRRTVAGSAAGLKETQDMIDFAAKHNTTQQQRLRLFLWSM